MFTILKLESHNFVEVIFSPKLGNGRENLR